MKNHKVMICHIIDVASPTNGRETLKHWKKQTWESTERIKKNKIKRERDFNKRKIKRKETLIIGSPKKIVRNSYSSVTKIRRNTDKVWGRETF